MIQKTIISLSALLVLSACTTSPEYVPNNALTGKHLIVHGNTGHITAEADGIFETTFEHMRKTPTLVSQYGSSIHVNVHMRNITDDDGELDKNLDDILDHLSHIADIYPDIAIITRHSMTIAKAEELNNKINKSLNGKVRHLELTDTSDLDPRNVRKPFSNSATQLTFVLFPTKLPN